MWLNRRIVGILKIWHLILLIIIAMVTVGGLLLRQKRKSERCHADLTTAEQEIARDNFDKALEYLKEARAYCDDKDVEVREVTARTFKVATAYDQVRLVKDKDNVVLKDIDDKLRYLRNLVGDTVELRVLQGIYEELSDRPEKGLEQYDLATKQQPLYASAYNSYGYTVFKWKIGGSSWSDTAVQKFKKAAELDPNYGWPYLNSALVYLQLADDAVNGPRPNLDDARKHLPNAKDNLEKAEKLLPDSPRVGLLWGHYHMLQGQIFSARGLKLEANDSYSEARKKLIDAKDKNADIADTHLSLGSVDFQLGMFDEAAYYFKQAVSLDDMNVIACVRYIQALSLSPKANEKTSSEINSEAKRGLGLIYTLRTRFTARSYETKDTDAREWLATTVKDYDEIEKTLKQFEEKTAVNRTDSVRKTPKRR